MTLTGRAILALIFLTVPGHFQQLIAQEKKVEEIRLRNNVITLLPQYLVSYGIRMDYERRIGHGDLWILIGPQYYAHDQEVIQFFRSTSIWRSYDELRGWGVNTFVKYVTHKSDDISEITGLPARSFYVSMGPTYQNYSYSNELEVPKPFIEDGITYYKFELEDVQTKLHRVGLNINVGMQFTRDRFVVDFYLGLGYKAALDENGEQYMNTYAQMIDPAYSGLIADAGFKIGFVF